MITPYCSSVRQLQEQMRCHNECHSAPQMETINNEKTYYDEGEAGYTADLETDQFFNNSPAVENSRGPFLWRILLILQVLAVGAFTCFALYAVVAGNTEAVRVSCPKLWQYMVARILCGIMIGALLLLGHYYLFGRQQQYQWASMSRGCSPWNMMVIFWALMFCYFCAFFVVGMTVIPNILSDKAGQLCSDTLSNTVITGTPLLAYLGWVSFICDGIASALILVLVIYLFAMTPTSYVS